MEMKKSLAEMEEAILKNTHFELLCLDLSVPMEERREGFWGSSWQLCTGVTTGGILGLELAAVHRGDDHKDSEAGTGRSGTR